jgi:hypothetical protein
VPEDPDLVVPADGLLVQEEARVLAEDLDPDLPGPDPVLGRRAEVDDVFDDGGEMLRKTGWPGRIALSLKQTMPGTPAISRRLYSASSSPVTSPSRKFVSPMKAATKLVRGAS